MVVPAISSDLTAPFDNEYQGLVRKSLSFSKKLKNHIAAIWSFVHYNAGLQPTFRRSLKRIDGYEIEKCKPQEIAQQKFQAFLS